MAVIHFYFSLIFNDMPSQNTNRKKMDFMTLLLRFLMDIVCRYMVYGILVYSIHVMFVDHVIIITLCVIYEFKLLYDA